MANEATLKVETEYPLNFEVADGTGISKGTLLKMTNAMTAAASAANDDVIAGIAATEKIANDGVTSLGVYRSGVFEMTADGTITTGDMVKSNAGTTENTIISISASASSTENVVGVALQDATDGETLLVELKPMQITYPA